MKYHITLFILALSVNAFAQIPGYVPTSGLVAWYPFSGNANDLSGNNLNGSVTGASLTTDRFSKSNSAYSFNGTSNYILISDNDKLSFTTHNFSISFWMNFNSLTQDMTVMAKRAFSGSSGTDWEYNLGVYSGDSSFASTFFNLGGNCDVFPNTPSNKVSTNTWIHFIFTADGSDIKLYKDGKLVGQTSKSTTCSSSNGTGPLAIGVGGGWGKKIYFKGKIDDVGIWNRALTTQEITILNEGCKLVATITPTTAKVFTGNNVKFSSSTNYSNSVFKWQSNGGDLGWFDVINNKTYSGATNDTLDITGVKLSNHLQPFRVIATQAECNDTSDIAIITITDTCIKTVTVTNYISVTDTLIIKANLTGINPPNNTNAVKVFPNPTKDHITINFGNYVSMNGYNVKIVNALGQTVFNSPINQQSSYINLSSLGGKGIYFIHIIDKTGNAIEIRKILLQ